MRFSLLHTATPHTRILQRLPEEGETLELDGHALSVRRIKAITVRQVGEASAGAA
ncbi:hypothetical protein [Xanthomonas fragariae]|uniref:hypothetical protein n=1 Tax=Xanthomonas fragariae TaxID=48664 RepID=UPI001ABE565D|nr:hypothetical protein [Xanthomonas fragariae]UKR54272.1 hypothetical protein K4A87_10435 [Xanthomonas fragariae]